MKDAKIVHLLWRSLQISPHLTEPGEHTQPSPLSIYEYEDASRDEEII